jgi:hypothetical protein
MATPHINYNDLFGPDAINSRITILGLSGGPVVGIISQDFTFSASNSFGTPLDNSAQNALSDTLMGAQALSGNVAARAGYKGGSLTKPFTLRTIEQSIKTWTGSDTPVFNILLRINAINEDDDVREDVASLLSAVAPGSLNAQGVSRNLNQIAANSNSGITQAVTSTAASAIGQVPSSQFLTPPLNYLPLGLASQGTLTISIGRWFKAHGQVMMSVTPTFSRETIQSGAPLFCDVSISFTPYRIITASELMAYISTPLAPVVG